MSLAARGLKFLSLVAAVALPVLFWLNYQSIEDWWRLRDYQPPAEIAALAEATTMTDSAKRTFYANHPQLLEQVASFRQSCPQSEQTVVLGCYKPGQDSIVIYDVTDPRLEGVHEATAAHELLHAAYHRLDSDEKDRIDNLLNDFYETEVTDRRIRETVDLYRQKGTENLPDEIHSIIGTEVVELSAELEQYYGRYFSDRSAVVAFVAEYEGEFSRRLAQIESYDSQLQTLKASIEAEERRLSAEQAALNQEKQRLDAQPSVSPEQAANFNSRVNAYNNDVRQHQADIRQYNALVAERNEIAGELKSLSSALDTRLTTQ